jgi:hypothetical protein
MTLEIDERMLGAKMDGMKRLSEAKQSSNNPYERMYSDYINAYSDIGLYISTVDGRHVVAKSCDM